MSILHRTLRRITPFAARRAIAQARRAIADKLSGIDAQIVRPGAASFEAPLQISLAQPIFETPTSHGKIINLERAAALLSAAQIPPGGVFSFWSIVGAPTPARGFAMGRAIVADEVSQDVGGGLCQISGLIYELGLRAGLDIVERHAHSRDLYTDETRFAPLGLDATVGYAFKDLRLRNSHGVPISFSFAIASDRIEARLHASAPIVAHRLDVVRDEAPTYRLVTVTRYSPDGVSQLIGANRYAIQTP